LSHVNNLERERDNFVNGLKKFRPPTTIFEVDRTKKSKDATVMMQKRALHSKIIEREHNNKNSIQEEEEYLHTEVPETFELPAEVQIVEEKTFRDEQFYMSPLPANYHNEKGMSMEKGSGLNSDAIVLDLNGDDKDTMGSKKSVMKWDRKRKKFVMAAANVDINSKKGGKKMKNESGQLVEAKKGKIYEDWKQKHKIAIPLAGDMEDDILSRRLTQPYNRFQHNKGQQNKKEEPEGKQKYKTELKSKDQITKERKEQAKKQAKMKRGPPQSARKFGGGQSTKRGGSQSAKKIWRRWPNEKIWWRRRWSSKEKDEETLIQHFFAKSEICEVSCYF